MIQKKSLADLLRHVTYLPDRTPEMSIGGGAASAFVQVAPYRDGAVFAGHYSGSSEWERHAGGDEIVMALEGRTTIVFLVDGAPHRIDLGPGELVVVPAGCWHRFEGSTQLKVLSVTPQPSDHRLGVPDT